MFLLTIVEILLVIIVTAYLLYKYAARDVPIYVFILTLLLKNEATSGVVEYKLAWNTIRNLWSTIYWATFIMTWIVLPIVQEYENAGEFTTRERLRRSLTINGIFYGVFAVIGVIFLLYLKLQRHSQWDDILAILAASSNAFGLLLVIVLLGYGLVEIPRTHFFESNHDMLLKYCQFKAVVIDENKNAAQCELDELIKKVYMVTKKNDVQADLKYHAEAILKKVPNDIVAYNKSSVSYINQREIENELGEITMSIIISLNKQIKKSVAELHRAECKWDELTKKAFHLEDITESKYAIDQRLKSTTLVGTKYAQDPTLLENLAWLWYVKIQRALYLIIAIGSAILSLAIIIGEKLIFTQENYNYLAAFFNPTDSAFKVQLWCLVPLLYMACGVNYGLFNLKLNGFFGMYDGHQTDAPSLVFTAINFSRVSTAICYNFLQMVHLGDTAFHSAMGDLDLVPVFGNSLSTILPILLIILVVFNVFNVYDKLMGFLGLERLQFTENYTPEHIAEGKHLLVKARAAQEKKLLMMNSSPVHGRYFTPSFTKFKGFQDITEESTQTSIEIIPTNRRTSSSVAFPGMKLATKV